MGVKTDYTREELIDICQRAIVPEDKWSNRDSERSHRGIGKAWALLSAGCEFQVMTAETERESSGCITDDETIWVRIWSKGFNYFESGDGEEDADDYRRDDFFYLPTSKRLEESAGGDWY